MRQYILKSITIPMLITCCLLLAGITHADNLQAEDSRLPQPLPTDLASYEYGFNYGEGIKKAIPLMSASNKVLFKHGVMDWLHGKALNISPHLLKEESPTKLKWMEESYVLGMVFAQVSLNISHNLSSNLDYIIAFQASIDAGISLDDNVVNGDIASSKKRGLALLKATSQLKKGIVSAGILYKVVEEGNGHRPDNDARLLLSYTGRLLNGVEFDSKEYINSYPALSSLALVPGLKKALMKMNVGSKWTVVIHPQSAFGSQGYKNLVQPNKIVIYDVELMDIKNFL